MSLLTDEQNYTPTLKFSELRDIKGDFEVIIFNLSKRLEEFNLNPDEKEIEFTARLVKGFKDIDTDLIYQLVFPYKTFIKEYESFAISNLKPIGSAQDTVITFKMVPKFEIINIINLQLNYYGGNKE